MKKNFNSKESPTLGPNIDTPVQFLKGVGPHRASLLARKDVQTVGDLLSYFPRAYEDRRAARNITSLVPNEIVSLKAQVVRVYSAQLGRTKRKIYDVVVKDASGKIHCKYFRVPYKGYFERLSVGASVRVVGKVTLYRGQIEFHHPDIVLDEEESEENLDAIVPIYPETEGLTSRALQKMIQGAFDLVRVPENLPLSIRQKFNLLPREKAWRLLHQPQPELARELSSFRSQAHYRVIFEEFFWLELLLAKKRDGIVKAQGPVITGDKTTLDKMTKSLPFELTGEQKKVLQEILGDIKKPHPMHRLVQGDVGSGKTIVALLAATQVIADGYQCALMAPTEILTEQHFLNCKRWLEPLGVRIAQLTGGLSKNEYDLVSGGLAKGAIDLVVGTHALIQDNVEFHNLGLVIIDEQHRFGVSQRGNLKCKGIEPHFLVMTATPIPRTLAMTVYGDLDVSVIGELPAGRQPIVTKMVYESKRENVMGFLKEKLEGGHQAYIIYPLVEESEKIDLRDAIHAADDLKKMFPNIEIGLLHGRMKSEEKEEVMSRFRNGDVQVLVSTTVIEVGVDVPNATLMLIEHSERFGLSQLHQLRGRVGRGTKKSFCILMLGQAVSEEAKARCEIMVATNDGFKIAEADLEMRGPGEFLGRRQSGLPGFRMAHLVRDAEILSQARTAAFELVQNDPDLKTEKDAATRDEFMRAQEPSDLFIG
jgi:ATP-dependent DNA helicase RecG